MNINQLRNLTGYYDTSSNAIYEDDIIIATIDGKSEAHHVKCNKEVWFWGDHALQIGRAHV